MVISKKRHFTDMDYYFKDLQENIQYDDSDIIHVEALRFWFYTLLQEDLHDMTEYWNNHKIIKLHALESSDGRPELMCCLAEDYGCNESKAPISLPEFSPVLSIYSTSVNYSFFFYIIFFFFRINNIQKINKNYEIIN